LFFYHPFGAFNPKLRLGPVLSPRWGYGIQIIQLPQASLRVNASTPLGLYWNFECFYFFSKAEPQRGDINKLWVKPKVNTPAVDQAPKVRNKFSAILAFS